MNEIWEVKEGSKYVWKVQAPKGVLTFTSEDMANKWVAMITKAQNTVSSTVNYQIMDKDQKVHGSYHPNYQMLIDNAKSEGERKYIEAIQKRDIIFAFNMVYVTQQKCGHYEVFQTPMNEHFELDKKLRYIEDEVKVRNCTNCICGRIR